MIRIVMAGSDPQERARLRQQLTEMQVADGRLPGGLPLAMEVVGQARDGQEAVHMTLVQKPDLVLLESDLPVLDGYEAAELITLASPGTLIGLIGGAETPADLRRALRSGVREFIPRPLRPETLGAALQSLLAIEERRHSAEFVNMTDPARIPMTICVTGAKGGVGKTTITSNLACALAQENPGNVVLVDLYTQF
jgi:pilus assembly protein CpaE